MVRQRLSVLFVINRLFPTLYSTRYIWLPELFCLLSIASFQIFLVFVINGFFPFFSLLTIFGCHCFFYRWNTCTVARLKIALLLIAQVSYLANLNVEGIYNCAYLTNPTHKVYFRLYSHTGVHSTHVYELTMYLLSQQGHDVKTTSFGYSF